MGRAPFRWPRIERTSDGRTFAIRPIAAEDLERQRAFIRRLSPESRYRRFLHAIREPSEDWLRAPLGADRQRALTLVATVGTGTTECIVGMASYAADAAGRDGEFAVAVADDWQCRGIGTSLMTVLFECAAGAGLRHIYGNILADNHRMIELAEWLGLRVDAPAAGGGTVRAWRPLG